MTEARRARAALRDSQAHLNSVMENAPLIMYELDGVPEDIAREAFRLAGHKLSVGTRFVKRDAEVL